jgi:hypothetical protein
MSVLRRTYEQLIIQASLDASFGARLVADPRAAALEAGFSPLMAESLVGLRAKSLPEFATALHRRVYGTMPTKTENSLHVGVSAKGHIQRTSGSSA